MLERIRAVIGILSAVKKMAYPALLLILLSSFSALLPSESSALSSHVTLGDFFLQDSSGSEVASPVINSKVFFSLRLANSDSLTQPFVVIFDVRDSNNYSTFVKLESGNLPKYSFMPVRTEWIPEAAGSYTVRAFAISSLESPEVLSPVETKSIVVLTSKPLILPQITTAEEPKQPNQQPANQNATNASPSLDELKKYTLEQINADRAKFKLPPVKLSDNRAAQVHAEDVLKTRQISHWMTNGEKPYMTYSRLGGQGYVTQNIAVAGNMGYYKDCTSGEYICYPLEPFKEIDHSEHEMMYNDTECCDNGHRDNILDAYHTHVSIGIAYDNYTFVLVQNFENIYITPQSPNDQTPIMQFADGRLTIQGKMTAGQFSPLVEHANTITIFYDPLPTANEYELHKLDNHYDSGKYVACVLQELQTMYCPGVVTLTAGTWSYNNTPDYDTFLIGADLHNALDKSGVYTIVLRAEPVNAKEYDASWQVYTYSIWHNQ